MSSGLNIVPIRAPKNWDAAWFERFVRDVLAKADIRNAIASSGITIEGTSDEVATLSASADVQALIDASLITVTDESGSLSNVRQLVAASNSIVLDDNGGASTITIDVGVVSLDKLGSIPDLSVLGVPAADDGYDPPVPVQSSANNTVLRRASDTLTFSQIVYADIEDATAVSVVGRSANSSGALADITAAANDTLLRRVGDAIGFGTVTAGMLADVDTDDLGEGATNLYFIDERAQDAVGGIVGNTATIEITYDDGTPSLTADLTAAAIASLALADTAIQPSAAVYTPSNVTTDRSFDADSTTLDEIADVLGTLIADMQAAGLIG